MKIGVFDSGIGGITVLKELRVRFPNEDFFYFGDNANLPYGTKSPEQIKNLSVSAAKFIHEEKIEALVIACNTASAIAIDEIRSAMTGIPVFSVVDAGVASIAKAVAKDHAKNILILGTRATVRSHIYSELIKSTLGAQAKVTEQACPLLVPMIEEAWLEHSILKQTVQEYLKAHSALAPGVALLACTHYPWIKPVFESYLPGWQVIDSAVAMGEALSQHFPQNSSVKNRKGPHAHVEWQFSDPGGVPNFIFSQNLIPPTLRIKS